MEGPGSLYPPPAPFAGQQVLGGRGAGRAGVVPATPLGGGGGFGDSEREGRVGAVLRMGGEEGGVREGRMMAMMVGRSAAGAAGEAGAAAEEATRAASAP